MTKLFMFFHMGISLSMQSTPFPYGTMPLRLKGLSHLFVCTADHHHCSESGLPCLPPASIQTMAVALKRQLRRE